MHCRIHLEVARVPNCRAFAIAHTRSTIHARIGTHVPNPCSGTCTMCLGSCPRPCPQVLGPLGFAPSCCQGAWRRFASYLVAAVAFMVLPLAARRASARLEHCRVYARECCIHLRGAQLQQAVDIGHSFAREPTRCPHGCARTPPWQTSAAMNATALLHVPSAAARP